MVIELHILKLIDFPSKSLLTYADENFFSYFLGATNILPLSKELIKMGHKITIFTGGRSKYPSYENIEGINVYRTILPRRGYYLPYSFGLIPVYKKIIKKHGPIDIIHAHSFKNAYGYSFIKPFIKKPLVVSHHSVSHPNYVDLSPIEKVLLVNNLTKAIDRLIVLPITRDHYNEFIKLGIDKDIIRTVSIGVNPNQFKKKRDTEKIILSPNRLVKWKNTETFLQAARMVLQNYNDYRFVILGDGPEKQNLVNLAKKIGISENVDFVGIVNPKDIVNYYSRAYVTVSPMKIESFGKVILESLSCNTPVISTDYGVPKDIKGCGIYGSKSDDIEFFADAMINLIKNKKLREQLGSKGRKIIIKKYQWKMIAKELLKVYEEIT
ncbi:MAG: glycosyltransferase family 4 protein [archaeon]